MSTDPVATAASWRARWVPFGWLRWQIGWRGSQVCYWLYDRLRGVENLGHRLHRWGYR